MVARRAMDALPVLRPCDVAERWQCSEQHVLELLELGQLNGFRLGRHSSFWRIRLDNLGERIPERPLGDGEVNIYIIRCEYLVKIGFSKSVRSRIKDMRSFLPFDVVLLHRIIGPRSIEGVLHRRFSDCRHRGEWFRIEGELEQWINRGFPEDMWR